MWKPRSSKSTRKAGKKQGGYQRIRPSVLASSKDIYLPGDFLIPKKQINLISLASAESVLSSYGLRGLQNRDSSKMDGEGMRKVSTFIHPIWKTVPATKDDNTLANTRRKRTDILVTWQQTVLLGSVDDTARRNASFSWDLCPSSSQWLIGEVFTALARMEHSLIAQLQITVMFLSDASATHFLKESPERYFFQGLSVFVGPGKAFLVSGWANVLMQFLDPVAD